MASLTTRTDLRYCRCGALCVTTEFRCRKCRARARWYRRKAWRCNPYDTQVPELTRKK
jgi:hypothetical protein